MELAPVEMLVEVQDMGRPEKNPQKKLGSVYKPDRQIRLIETD